MSAGLPEGGAPPAVVLFGVSEAGKPRASRFDEGSAELAIEAAGLMGLKVLKVATDEQRTVALGLPVGRLFDSGRAHVPFCRKAAHDALAAFEGAFAPPAPVEPGPMPDIVGPATDWSQLAPGRLVLAGEEFADGCSNWWPAVIVLVDEAAGTCTLRWRDWPDFEEFERPLDCLGLISRSGSGE